MDRDNVLHAEKKLEDVSNRVTDFDICNSLTEQTFVVIATNIFAATSDATPIYLLAEVAMVKFVRKYLCSSFLPILVW